MSYRIPGFSSSSNLSNFWCEPNSERDLPESGLLRSMSSIRPAVMIADEAACAFAESSAPARAESGGPALHATDEMRRLATPWAVASARAGLIEGSTLPPGVLLDPACGSATQLAALCSELGRGGIGVELSGAIAPLAAVNLARAAAWAEADWGAASRVLWGDGIEATAILAAHRESLGASPPIALLHIDPARPADAQRHTLDEMQPRLDLLLRAWAPHLAANPALILDLSPRLSAGQRSEVASIVSELWPEAATTWQWMTQGRGRIDRLSLWVGPIADPAGNRLLRLSKQGDLSVLSGQPSEAMVALDLAPSSGQTLSLVDPSLIASGLAEAWRERASPEGESGWLELDGRRPVFLSENPLVEDEVVAGFVQVSGQILSVVTEVSLEAVDTLCENAHAAGLSSLKLRCRIAPAIQPRFQSAVDRGMARLSEEGESVSGFLAEACGSHLICGEVP